MSWSRRSLAPPLLLLGLVVATILVRLGPRDHLLAGEGLLIHDLDTLRRLARLEALDAADTYPIVETHDGWPAGTMLHWTRPMDAVIRGLDPLVSWLLPSERGHEAGAVLAGPLLAAAAVVLFVFLATRLLGAWAALVAGALYALSYSFVNTSLLGNGDHQTLQQLAAVAAVLGLLRAYDAPDASDGTVASRAARRWAAIAGAALGFAVWVSTELMLLFYALALAVAVAAGWPWRVPDRRDRCADLPLPFAGGVLALVCVGHLVEHPHDLLALRWDAVSWFQLWQVAVFAVFAATLRLVAVRGAALRPAVAAGAALALGCAPFAVPGLAAAVAGQVREAAETSVWLHAEVSEFRGLFRQGAGALLQREGWLALCLPLALAGLLWSSLRPPARMVLAMLAVCTFALYVWEVKLGHLFALVLPLALVAGWRAARRRFLAGPGPWLDNWLDKAAAAAAIGSVFAQLPPPRSPILRNNDRIVREISAVLAARRAPAGGESEGGVLAPWDMGAPLMYHAGVGVVASGYHRNLEGIRDGFRFWLTDVAQRDRAMELLQRRRVRWVVAWYDRGFLDGGARTLGRPPLRTERAILPEATRTMFWQLRYGKVSGFTLVHDGPAIQLGSGPPEPIYRIFEVEG